ncbi:subtilisin-like protease SBT1.2 [Tanacetum coccineum]
MNEAPWILTVGATTIDRQVRTTVSLGNKKLLDGGSLYQNENFNHKFRPLVYPGKDGDKKASMCVEGSLDHIDVKGKVVICDQGSAQHCISSKGGFSSRGPNFASPGILKPDILGPGVDILAAWSNSVDNKTTKATFNIVSGTSMSCPHLAVTAALLKSAHPEWSPAASSGHVNPSKANDPGLVFDIQPDDYIPYLCGLGYTPKQVQMIVRKTDDDQCWFGKLNLHHSAPDGVTVIVGSRFQELSFTEMHQKLEYEIVFTWHRGDDVKVRYGQGNMTWVSGKYSVRTPFAFTFE